MATHECDICIIGGGITAAMVSQKLSELQPGKSIIVVEAGKRLFDFENRFEYRQRSLDYGENQWPGDFVEDQGGRGIISRTMAVGGSALHWGGVCNRFSEEDTRLKSMYGLATDWPIEWKELEKFYCEAERRIGVSGEPSPIPEDKMSQPYPMPAMTITYNLKQLKTWAEKSGAPFWTTPQAKNTTDGYNGRGKCRRCNTCEVCPTGARYSPDWTFKQLLDGKKIQLHDETLVRRLILDEKTSKIVAAQAVKEDGSTETHEYRAKTFVIASGYTWSSHLLLLSANPRFPNGLANSSDHVGRYMTGHLAHETSVDLDVKIYPGMNEQHSLISRQFFRCKTDQPYVRHDLRVWENARGTAERGCATPTSGKDLARRRAHDRIAHEDDGRHGAKGCGRITTCIRTRTAGSRSIRRRRIGGAIRCRLSRTSQTPRRSRAKARRASIVRICLLSLRKPMTERWAASARSRIRIIRPAAAAWAPIHQPASSTRTAARTITRTCLWWDRRCCQRADARMRL